MTDHTITFDISRKHNSKPTNVGAVSANLKTVKKVTIEEFAKAVTQPYGFSFTPAIFKDNKRSNRNWLQQSVFALDFDNGFTPEEAIAKLELYGLSANVIYTSFSDTPDLRKFRVLLFLDTVITDKKLAKFIILNLMDLFDGEVDIACKDYARLFFGGKECLHLDTIPTNTIDLLNVLNSIKAANDKFRTRSLVDVTEIGYTRASLYNNNKDVHLYTSFVNPYKNNPVKRFNWELATEKVKILRDFLNGKWLHHPQLFGLATNLLNINGGEKLMRLTMEKYNKMGKTFYTENNFGIFPSVKKNNYSPMRLQNFSLDKEDHQYLNIITAARDLQGAVEQLNTNKKMNTLEESEKIFKDEFDKARDAESGVFIFKLPTGIGKTRALEDISGVTMAFPTHTLKSEVQDRMKVDCLVTPELPVFDDETINDRIDFLYRNGFIAKATKLISDIATDLKHKYHQDDKLRASYYLKKTRECYASEKTVLTTHQKAMFGEFNSDTLMFDEDPLQSFLSMKSFKIGELNTLIGKVGFSEELNKVRDFLQTTLISDMPQKTPLYTFDIDALTDKIADANIETNIIDFLNSDYIVKSAKDQNIVHIITKREIPDYKKIIILSATASDFIYRQIFGDDITVIDLMDTEQTGNIIQNTKFSFSRSGIAKQGERVEALAQKLGDIPVITFMKYKNYFKNAVKEMHFGNCSGYDDLKGEDIAVVGTPHYNNDVYTLYALALGIKVKPRDFSMSYEKIEHNGFRFKFNCYAKEELKQIQLALIESELVQAVGRARTLRENATVYVYSNFPLRQTTTFIRENVK